MRKPWKRVVSKPCEGCGAVFKPKTNRTKFCTKPCANRNNNGKGLRAFAFYRVKTGYRCGWARDESGRLRRITEHRWVMEQHVGRRLTPMEHVHHKNGDRGDNRIENLEIVAKGKHLREHNLESWAPGGARRLALERRRESKRPRETVPESV